MIEPKPKKCKGTGLAKGYGCGNVTKYRVYGLGKMCCYTDWLLNSENGRIKLKKATLKATKPRVELEKETRKINEEKKLPVVLEQTQKIFNKYIRLRDRNKPCISSNANWKQDFDAGHLFSVKQYSALRFNEDNVHGQSIGDNRFKEGNFDAYLINLKYRIGQERLNNLISKAEQSKRTFKKWTISELEEIKTKYKLKIKNYGKSTISSFPQKEIQKP